MFFIKKFFTAVEKINYFFALLTGIILIIMTFSVSREVFGRYLLNSPSGWVLVLNQMLLVAMTYLGAGHTLRQDGHVRADFIYSHLSRKPRLIIDTIATALTLFYCTFIVWQGWDYAWESFSKGSSTAEAVDWPLFPSQVLVPIGTFLLGLQAIINLIKQIESKR